MNRHIAAYPQHRIFTEISRQLRSTDVNPLVKARAVRRKLMSKKQKPGTQETRARHWTFTVNEPEKMTKEVQDRLAAAAEHFAWQLEQAPSTGHLHYQCYIGFPQQLRFAAVKSLLPAGAHIEMCINPAKSWEYCLKDDTCADPTTRKHSAECPKGQREGLKQNEWTAFQEYARSHTWGECLENWARLRTHESTMRAIFEMKMSRDHSLAKSVTCFWGPPGTGKSLTVRGLLEGKEYFRAFNGKWFDGYAYEKILWIDDMQPKQFTRASFLQLCDFGTVRMEVKGGTVLIVADTIYITSNYHPSDWFEKGEAACRRMTIYHVVPGDVGLDQRQGNTVPAVAQKNQQTLLQLLGKAAADSIAVPPDDSPTETATQSPTTAEPEAQENSVVGTLEQLAKFAKYQPPVPDDTPVVSVASLERVRHLSQIIHDDVERTGDIGGPSDDDGCDATSLGHRERPAEPAGRVAAAPKPPGRVRQPFSVRFRFGDGPKNKQPAKPSQKGDGFALKRTHARLWTASEPPQNNLPTGAVAPTWKSVVPGQDSEEGSSSASDE